MPILAGLGRSRPLRLLIIPVLALPLFGFGGLESLFAPKSELWDRWERHDSASTEVIDHGAWDQLLQRHIKRDPQGIHRFDYRAVVGPERQALDAYIGQLGRVNIDDYNRNEQYAYWVNLYNALTVQVVLDHYPVDSIRDIDISPGLFADGPWDKPLITVLNEELSLNDIEHRILRPIWNDPRIHYAVNCAAIGCPNLQSSAFTGAALDSQLDQAAREFVNSPRGVHSGSNGLVVSSIYAWFSEDFGGNTDGIIAHLKRYAEGETAAKLEGANDLAGHEYDWSLNRPLGQGS